MTNPGLFTASDRMLRRLRPDCYGLRAWFVQRRHDRAGTLSLRDLIKEQLWLGSIQAAVVVSMDPGRVAAYADMLDCVAMLAYPTDYLRGFGLREGDRLLTVNYYDTGPTHSDLVFGPGKCSTWTGFNPIIADFTTEDAARLEERKRALAEQCWARAWELGIDRLRQRPEIFRSGVPCAPAPTRGDGRGDN